MLTRVERLISTKLPAVCVAVIVFCFVFEALDSADQHVIRLNQFMSLFSVGSNFFLAIFISFLCHYLVVSVPESRRRKGIDATLSFQCRHIDLSNCLREA